MSRRYSNRHKDKQPKRPLPCETENPCPKKGQNEIKQKMALLVVFANRVWDFFSRIEQDPESKDSPADCQSQSKSFQIFSSFNSQRTRLVYQRNGLLTPVSRLTSSRALRARVARASLRGLRDNKNCHLTRSNSLDTMCLRPVVKLVACFLTIV